MIILTNSWLPDQVLRIAHELHEHGYFCYLVGGAVRDHFLGTFPNDFDLVTDAPHMQLQVIFPGTVIRNNRNKIAVVPFRGKYFEVSQLSMTGSIVTINDALAIDALSRDFKFNSIYFNIREEKIFDPQDGLYFLRKKVISSIQAPKDAIRENPLIMLRAIRFAEHNDLAIESEFKIEMANSASMILVISSDRLLVEMQKHLTNGHAYSCIREISKYGILRYFWPSLDALLNMDNKNNYLKFVLEKIDQNIYEGSILSIPAIMSYLLWGHFLEQPCTSSSIERTFKELSNTYTDGLQITERFSKGIYDVFALQAFPYFKENAINSFYSKPIIVVAKNLMHIRKSYQDWCSEK